MIILTHEYEPFHGGVATYCSQLARHIAEAGHPLEVWAPNFSQSHPSRPDTDPLQVRRLDCPGNLKIPALIKLAQAVWRDRERLRGKFLLLPSVGAQMVVSVLSLLPGWPRPRLGILWHGSEILRFQRNPLWRVVCGRMFGKADAFFAASFFVQKMARRSPLVPLGQEVTLVPCAPGAHAYHPPAPRAQDPIGRIRILTLARLHPRKGQLQTIRALAQLPPDLKSKIVYQVAGAGKPRYLKKIRKSCAKAGIPLEYLGAVPDSQLSSVYAQCDIYAMTSVSLSNSIEGFGITYLEAGLQSKPVIAHRSGGVEGAVIHDKTGLLVDEGNVGELTRAFASLISNPSLRKSLGEGNFQHASGFSWKRSAEILVQRIGTRNCGSPDKKR